MREIIFEIIGGVEGACLAIMDEGGGYRIAGPKPWGGGEVLYSFKCDVDEVIKKINRYAKEREDKMTFKEELKNLINKHSLESESNTPDHILAEYICDCLNAFDSAVNARNNWPQQNNKK